MLAIKIFAGSMALRQLNLAGSDSKIREAVNHNPGLATYLITKFLPKAAANGYAGAVSYIGSYADMYPELVLKGFKEVLLRKGGPPEEILEKTLAILEERRKRWTEHDFGYPDNAIQVIFQLLATRNGVDFNSLKQLAVTMYASHEPKVRRDAVNILCGLMRGEASDDDKVMLNTVLVALKDEDGDVQSSCYLGILVMIEENEFNGKKRRKAHKDSDELIRAATLAQSSATFKAPRRRQIMSEHDVVTSVSPGLGKFSVSLSKDDKLTDDEIHRLIELLKTHKVKIDDPTKRETPFIIAEKIARAIPRSERPIKYFMNMIDDLIPQLRRRITSTLLSLYEAAYEQRLITRKGKEAVVEKLSLAPLPFAMTMAQRITEADRLSDEAVKVCNKYRRLMESEEKEFVRSLNVFQKAIAIKPDYLATYYKLWVVHNFYLLRVAISIALLPEEDRLKKVAELSGSDTLYRHLANSTGVDAEKLNGLIVRLSKSEYF
jgi:hypothetical protein